MEPDSGWLESVTPVNGEHGVNRLGTSRLEVVGVDRMGGVNFQIVTRIPYDGFLWGFGVVTPDEDKVTRTRILEVLEVVGSRYRVQTGGFVGILGWMVVTVVNPMMLVASWKGGGVLGWFPNQNVV